MIIISTHFLILNSLASLAPISLFQILFKRPPGTIETVLTGVVGVLVLNVVVLLFAMLAIWAERKVAGHIQSRIGPNRVGPIGLLQSLADGIKLLLKEDLIPREADRLLFRLAPYLCFVPAFAAFVALPFGPNLTAEPGLNAGVFWILAILSVEAMGIILAGWASNNKWAVYGAMREACQMVSYEIPLGISIIIGVMNAGTLNMVELGHLQGGGVHTWLVFRNPFVFLASLIFFIASLASTKRAPFDLPESESELVAGYHTEYSGMRWSFFFFGEYAAMFVVGGIQAALFLGGWHDPLGILGYYYARFMHAPFAHVHGLLMLNFVGAVIFTTKCSLLVFVQMWIRWTLPRPRIDQVLHTCIKVLLPISCALLLAAAVWQLLIDERPGLPWIDYQPWQISGWRGYGGAIASQIVLTVIGVGGLGATVLWIVYAAITGRKLKQRLTEPAAF